jgi:hypothetical protein
MHLCGFAIYKGRTRKGNDRRPEAYINSGGFSLTHVLAYAARVLPSLWTHIRNHPQDSSPPIPILNLSCTCFCTILPPQTSSLRPSNANTAPSALSLATGGLRADPSATLCLLSSNATLFFVTGTFAALEKQIAYTNGAQISLEKGWCAVIVPFLVGEDVVRRGV